MNELHMMRGSAAVDVDERTDAELLDAAGDDTHAFGVLFDRYARVLFAAGYAIVQDRHAAEEIVSDAFIVLWRRRSSIVLTDTALPWLLTTARYLARNRRRGAHVDLELNDEIASQPVPSAEHVAIVRDLNRQLVEVIDTLAPLDRSIVTLCLVDGLSYDDAAARLGISHGVVRNRLSRSRVTMRRLLSNPTEQEEQ